MKTECCVIRDLLPLYAEDLVSAETADVIRLHLHECPDCDKEYLHMQDMEKRRAELVQKTDDNDIKPFKKMMKKANRTLSAMCFALTVMLLFLGVVKSDGANAMLMYNAVIMPVCGACGYVAFRMKAVIVLPLLLLLTDGLAYAFDVLPETVNMILWLSGIYCIFILAGILIAALFHYALRKE
ncbi:MAG: zf-HC2 domain-containing protein [Clostridia bacterium]|nr:zf-HC2 domain-containing protein [Clostridia bacterium]